MKKRILTSAHAILLQIFLAVTGAGVCAASPSAQLAPIQVAKPAPSAELSASRPSEDERTLADLNKVLETILHGPWLMTIGGVKPFTSDSYENVAISLLRRQKISGDDDQSLSKTAINLPYNEKQAYDILARAVKAGLISNPELKIYQTPIEIYFENVDALSRLGRDKTVRAIFAKWGGQSPDTVEQWEKFCRSSDGFQSDLDRMMGICYGYPPLEVERFAQNSEREELRRVKVWSTNKKLHALLSEAAIAVPSDRAGWNALWKKAVQIAFPKIGVATPSSKLPAWVITITDMAASPSDTPCAFISLEAKDFVTPAYARFTKLEPERDIYYTGAAERLMENCRRLEKEGRTPLEIINHPQWLKKGLPRFPSQYLEN